MSAWDACTQDPHWIVRQIECHPGAAGWAQAVGAILAIGAAFLISQIQISQTKRLEEDRRRSKARALSYLLAPSVARIVVNARHITATIAAEEHGLLMITKDPIDAQRAVHAMTFGVQIDHALLQRLDSFPADAALKVVQLFSFVEDFDGLVREHLPESRAYSAETRGAYVGDVDQKLARIIPLVNDVCELLESICK